MPHVRPSSPVSTRFVQHGRNGNVSPWRRSARRTQCRVRKPCARPSSLSVAHCASRGRTCSVESWRRSACHTQCRVPARPASSASFGALFPPCPHIHQGLESRGPDPVSEAWPAPSRQARHADPSLTRLRISTGTATNCKGGRLRISCPRKDRKPGKKCVRSLIGRHRSCPHASSRWVVSEGWRRPENAAMSSLKRQPHHS